MRSGEQPTTSAPTRDGKHWRAHVTSVFRSTHWTKTSSLRAASSSSSLAFVPSYTSPTPRGAQLPTKTCTRIRSSTHSVSSPHSKIVSSSRIFLLSWPSALRFAALCALTQAPRRLAARTRRPATSHMLRAAPRRRRSAMCSTCSPRSRSSRAPRRGAPLRRPPSSSRPPHGPHTLQNRVHLK